MNTDIIYNKVSAPYGWLSLMSPHKVVYKGITWRTAEALFQSMRFSPYDDAALVMQLRSMSSPVQVKTLAEANASRMCITPASTADLENLYTCVYAKVMSNPNQLDALKITNPCTIIADMTTRRKIPGSLCSFWGMIAVKNSYGEVITWKGENMLGKAWMNVRSTLLSEAQAQVEACKNKSNRRRIVI